MKIYNNSEELIYEDANISMRETVIAAMTAAVVLINANLSRQDLSMISFLNVDLSGANLSGAYFAESLFYKTNLTGCNLQNVNLSGVLLAGINLTNADLKDAILQGSAFIKVNFTGSSVPIMQMIKAFLYACDYIGMKFYYKDKLIQNL